jgi:hypothetical protein
MDKVQILTDDKGRPAFAVVPWKDFERMKAAGEEDQRLIALATPHRREPSFPADVAKRLVRGEAPTKVFREWRELTQQQFWPAPGSDDTRLSWNDGPRRARSNSIGRLRHVSQPHKVMVTIDA